MADEPTIEEAIKHATFVAEYYDGWVPETTAAIRTLLASHASLEEALAPFAAVGRAMIQSLPDDDRIFTIKPAGNGPDVVLYRGSLRAAARTLAAFVNEKERTDG